MIGGQRVLACHWLDAEGACHVGNLVGCGIMEEPEEKPKRYLGLH